MKLMLFGLFCLAQVFACDCKPPQVQTALKNADVVFIGMVQKAEIFNVEYGAARYRSFKVYIFTFKVQKVWKGQPTEELMLYDLNTNSCTMRDFVVGREYLVFARTMPANALKKEIWGQLPGYGKPIPTSDICSRTAWSEEAKDDIDFLKRHYAGAK